MKKLIIKQILLRNFKGIREVEVNLNDNLTKILGCNGAGKSTLADAVSYCLFGKDSKGNAQFGLKTRDEEGNEIPHLEHEATLIVSLDDCEHKLSRILREKWSKPRGSSEEVLTGNVIDYFIDNEKVTKTDYDKFVFAIAGDEIFRLLTIPSHFPTLPWQTQLEKLFDIVGDLTNDDIAGSDPLYADILAELETKSLEAYSKHIGYSIRELKKKIDEMPIRIDTLNKTLPLRLEWETIETSISSLTDEYNKVGEQIYQCKQGNASDIHNKMNRERIAFLQNRIDNIEKSKRYSLRVATDNQDKELRQAKNELEDAMQLMQELSRKRMSLDAQINQCNNSIRELKSAKQSGFDEWEMINKQRFVAPEDITICPTCHQYLPEDEARKAVSEARKTFNENKALRLENLNKRGMQISNDLEQANNLKEQSISELKITNEQEQQSAIIVKEKKDFYDKLQKKPLPTINDLLNEDENYQKLLRDLNEAEKPAEVEQDNTLLEELTAKQETLNKQITELRSQLDTRTQYERVARLIEEAKSQWRTLNNELTQYERKQDIARQFSERRDNILEQRVNALFKFTRFRLYKTQVDGITREPFCTASLNGVEYKDLNNASKIAVGLDIINALSRYYDVAVPVVVDNAEACNDIPDTIGQQILLYVSTNSELTIL